VTNIKDIFVYHPMTLIELILDGVNMVNVKCMIGEIKEMNKLQKVRWDSAVRIFTQINKFLDDGYLVFDNNNEQLLNKYRFEFDEEKSSIKLQVSENVIYGFFEESSLELTVTQFKKYINLKAWGVVNPRDIKRIK
jgi:hypothetical protein